MFPFDKKSRTSKFLAVAAVAGVAIAASTAAETFEERRQRIQREFRQNRDDAIENYRRYSTTANADFVQARREATEEFEAFRDGVIEIWGEFPESTDNQWWSYSQDRFTRVHADLNTGVVQTEVIIEGASLEDAMRRIAAGEFEPTVRETLLPKVEEQGELATAVELPGEEPQAVVEQVVEQITNTKPSDLKELPSKEDDTKRFVTVATIRAKPHPFEKRAEAFWPQIVRYSETYDVDPALILAVMHTESAFRPTAVSHAGAVGLMQIMPRWAGLEAKRIIEKNTDVPQPTREELYDPTLNIHYGTVYLRQLQKAYYRGISDCHNSFFSICGYNWGPGRVKSVNRKHGLYDMSELDAFNALRAGEKFFIPEETRKYLTRVHQRRMQIWTPYVQQKLGSTYPGAPRSCALVPPVD